MKQSARDRLAGKLFWSFFPYLQIFYSPWIRDLTGLHIHIATEGNIYRRK